MERRFVVFLVVTLLLWGGFIALRVYVFPPEEQVAEEVAAEPDGRPADEPAADKDGQPKDKPDNKAKPKPKADIAADKQPPADAPAVADSKAPRVRPTLGSLAPTGPYQMGVTFDSRGAAVERVELKHYKDISDESGYLGHLSLTDAKGGGAEVNVVVPGTPAALATTTNGKPGLLVGDVIHQIDSQVVADAPACNRYLREKTHPDDVVRLTVERNSAAKPLSFTVKLTRRPLEVVRPEPHTYEVDGKIVNLPQDPLSLLVSLENIGGRSIKDTEEEIAGLTSLTTSNWTLDKQGQDFVQFSYTLDAAALEAIGKTGECKIVKRYTIGRTDQKDGKPGYHLDLQVEIHNLGNAELPVAYRLLGPTGLPLEGWWYSSKLSPKMFHGAGARDVAWKQLDQGHRMLGCPELVADAKVELNEDKPPLIPLLTSATAPRLVYAGVDTQFFAAAVLPKLLPGDKPLEFSRVDALPVQDVTEIPKAYLRTADVSFRTITKAETIAPGTSLVHKYEVFFGPKEPDVLEAYGLHRFIEYGWPIFKVPAQFLGGILYYLNKVIHNYGIAIILLTIIVRSCMVPISLKQARSAAKMQELAPEIQKIKDKHPDDPVKQHQAVQDLYKKHNFNPFGGCLLVFIQLPIFIGLYRCLSVDIYLRDASLIPGIAWASNLAGPDKLFYWKDWMWGMLAGETGWLGPYFNVLPIITVVLFLIQQKMFTPPATDEQTQMQQKMMTYMTVFMGVMFYKVPAGLCLYFITSSLWGICERKFITKSKPKPPSGGEGGSGVVAKLPARPASPNGSEKPVSTKKKKQKQRR